jgi:hypothetical protein
VSTNLVETAVAANKKPAAAAPERAIRVTTELDDSVSF